MGLNLIWSTIVWIVLIGGLSFYFRKRITEIISKIPLPLFLLFLIVGTFYSIIEENINCPPTGCVLIPFTIPIFFIFLVIHLAILKLLRVKNFYIGILIFGLLGWADEFLLGNSKAILWSSPQIFLLMTVWTILTYSVIVVVPVTILLKSRK